MAEAPNRHCTVNTFHTACIRRKFVCKHCSETCRLWKDSASSIGCLCWEPKQIDKTNLLELEKVIVSGGYSTHTPNLAGIFLGIHQCMICGRLLLYRTLLYENGVVEA